MDDRELADWLKYSDSKSLLIINENNRLQVLYCPFKVLVIVSVGVLIKGQIVLVIEIKVTRELIIVYIINGDAYYYYHFEILKQ